MKPKAIIVKRSKIVEKRFRLLNFADSLLILFALPISVLILNNIFQSFQHYTSRISILYPTIHLLLFFASYIFIFLLNLEPVKKLNTNKIGLYNRNDIRLLFDEIAKENFSQHNEIPSFYIVKHFGNNAFAINSLFMNSIKKLNAIAVSRELFDYLSVDELKAVIAHEIGHFKKYISIEKRIRFVPFSFILLITYISTALLVPALGIPNFILYLICFFVVKKILAWPFNLFNKDAEFLSDLYSANKYGKLNTINALIKIYQMNNLDILLNMEISKFVMQSTTLEIRDIQKIKNRIKRKISNKIYDEDLIKDSIYKQLRRLNHGKKRKLSENEIEKRNNSLGKYLDNLEKFLENKTIDWNDIDNHKRDGKIDSVEYDGLIETLKNNPELQLFKTPNDNVQKMRFGTHPALRERILFIDKNVRR